MAKKTREMSISLLLDSGEEITEENIQAAMGSDDGDQMMVDGMLKSLQSLRDKSNIPMAIGKLGVLIAAAIGKLASAFKAHSHSIVVNPTPINIETPGQPLPLPAPAGGGRKFTMKINRDQNGIIDTVDIIEE